MPGLINAVETTDVPKLDTGNTYQTTVTNYQANAPKADDAKYDVNAATDTVGGQLEGILSKESPLLKRAESQGLQAANSRGLLNSTMGVQAGQSALMDKALQIATPDAATYSAAGMKNADMANSRYLSDSGIAANFGLTDQNARNDLTKIQQNAAYDANKVAIEGQYGLEKTGMEITGAMERVQADAAATMERLLAENAAKLEQLDLDIKADINKLYIDNQAEMARLSATLDQRYVEAFAASYTPMNQQYMTDWVKIATSPDYASPADKQADLDALSFSFKANTETLAALYGYDITMGSMADAFGTESPSVNTQLTTLQGANEELQKQLTDALNRLTALENPPQQW